MTNFRLNCDRCYQFIPHKQIISEIRKEITQAGGVVRGTIKFYILRREREMNKTDVTWAKNNSGTPDMESDLEAVQE